MHVVNYKWKNKVKNIFRGKDNVWNDMKKFTATKFGPEKNANNLNVHE